MSDKPSPSKRPRQDEEEAPAEFAISDSVLVESLQKQLDAVSDEAAVAEEASRAAVVTSLELDNAKLQDRVRELESALKASQGHIKTIMDVTKAQQKLLELQSNTLRLHQTSTQANSSTHVSVEDRTASSSNDSAIAIKPGTSSDRLKVVPVLSQPASLATTPDLNPQRLLETAKEHLALGVDSLRSCLWKLQMREGLGEVDLPKMKENHRAITQHSRQIQSLSANLQTTAWLAVNHESNLWLL